MVSCKALSRFIVISFAAFLSVHAVTAGELVQAQGSVTLPGGGLDLQILRQTGQPPVGGLVVTEGVEHTPIKWSAPENFQGASGSVSYNVNEVNGGLRLNARLRSSNCVKIDLAFHNTGTAQRLLEVAYSLPMKGSNLRWYDGREENVPGTDEAQYERLHLHMPVSAVYDDANGIAVGLDPHFMSSFFFASADKTDEGLLVRFSVRIVLDPGQKLTLPMYIFRFEPRYGYLDAVQKIYDLFPDMFSAAEGVRPQYKGYGGGYLWSSKDSRLLEHEEARRFGNGWEWSYCPCQTPGDWYPDEEFWLDKVGFVRDYDDSRHLVPGMLEQYREAQRERFHRGWWSTALSWYILPQCADATVVKRYPDSAVVHQDGKISQPFGPWIRPEDRLDIQCVYPWGNSYGRAMIKDIEKLGRDFQVSGIAFDMASHVFRQYAKNIEGEPARGWDATGVFSSVQVGIGRLGDFIHTQKVRGYTMATVFNGPWSYNTSTRSDVAMHEFATFQDVDNIPDGRILMGHKAMTWWGWLSADEILDWERLQPSEIVQGVDGIIKYTNLFSLRYGSTSMNIQFHGSKSTFELMPVLRELIAEGWQAVPAAKTDKGLWLSRYGNGVKSFLAAGNPNTEKVDAVLSVDPGYLGKGHFLFSDFKGAPLSVKSNGSVDLLDLGAIKARNYRVARALVQLVPAGESQVAGSASCSWEPLKEGLVEAQWSISRAEPVAGKSETIVVRLPQGATPIQLLINGKPWPFKRSNGDVVCRLNLPDSGNLKLAYRPQVVVECGKDTILDFPFVTNNTPSSAVIVAEDMAERDRISALRVATYFEWYNKRQVAPSVPLRDLVKQKTPDVTLPIVNTGEKDGRFIELRKSAHGTSINISADGRRLIVEGPTPQAREAAVFRMLSILDETHPYYSAFPSDPIYVKAGLAGKQMPEVE